MMKQTVEEVDTPADTYAMQYAHGACGAGHALTNLALDWLIGGHLNQVVIA